MTIMADLITSKILWSIIISTINSKHMYVYIKKIYLCALLYQYEYMRIPLSVFLEHIVQQYNLQHKAKKGYVYFDNRLSIYGLPQSGALANKCLKNLPHMDILKSHTPQDYGNTSYS